MSPYLGKDGGKIRERGGGGAEGEIAGAVL
jgi:hypothetical protein